jgi:Nucleotidyl transferase AbiEii toxin, Type IV TA system
VASAFIQFNELLFELGVSPHRSQLLSIKIEVDMNPPSGTVLETTLIRRYVTLNLLHHDKSLLLAGKIHALLSRSFVKGRDLYDLIWYLSDTTWPEPNMILFNSALRQTGWNKPPLTLRNWRSVLHKKIMNINWKEASNTVGV